MRNYGTGHHSGGMIDHDGDRKYLDEWECRRFYFKRKIIKDMSHRTIVEVLYWTGCRMTEAVNLKVRSFNVRASTVTIKTLKQHGKIVYRVVQLPRLVMWRLNRVHDLKTRQAKGGNELEKRVWKLSRQKALKIVQEIMGAAGIYGSRATGRGLRHSYAVRQIMNGRALNLVQSWLGHRDIRTTTIYTGVSNKDARRLARKSWSLIEVLG